MIYKAIFFKSKHKKFQDLFFLPAVKKSHLSARDGRTVHEITEAYVRSTVLLNCSIKDEIRAVDSQSDLRILF